jgi:glycosyltransferase involved in cell wall biosynthesis
MHLTASPSYGGPERQMLGLGKELADRWNSIYVSFLEEGRCHEFIRQAQSEGFGAHTLRFDTPRLFAALAEVIDLLRSRQVSLLFCHGYKAGLLGRIAARRIGIPVAAVSRGWTGESLRVRLFESLDRINLRRMDRVVCVSHGQAAKVRHAGVRDDRIVVIHNAVRCERFARPNTDYRNRLLAMFPQRPALIVGAAGRLSPEKGFDVLIDAAAEVLASPRAFRRGVERAGPAADQPSIGFILFGDGPLRDFLSRRIMARGLEGRFILAGFQNPLDHYLPHLDLLVQSSHSEGLPNVVLEASAAGVPVVATAVGGTPEVIEHGVNGYLVPPGDAAALGAKVVDLLADDSLRATMGLRARETVQRGFSFAAQAEGYQQLYRRLTAENSSSATRDDAIPANEPVHPRAECQP